MNLRHGCILPPLVQLSPRSYSVGTQRGGYLRLVTQHGVVLTLSTGVVLMTSLFDHAVSVCALAARQNSFFIRKRTMNGPPTRNELAPRSYPAGTQRGVSPPCGFRPTQERR